MRGQAVLCLTNGTDGRTVYEEFELLRKYDELDGKTLLIGVGAAKCGTSWISHYLQTLPGVVASPLKEIHFFDRKFSGLSFGDMDSLAIKRVGFHMKSSEDPVAYLATSELFQASVDRMKMIYDDNAYFGHLARLCDRDTSILCDITPGYSVLGLNGFSYMQAFCATQNIKLKLLFVMRDPVDRLWSQLRHLQEINPESEITDNWAKALESPRVCARGDYEGTISDLELVFPEEDLLYLFYEDLFCEACLRRLCAFIGADYRPGETGTRQNRTGVELELPDDARLAFQKTLTRQYRFCSERFAEALPAAWLAHAP